MAKLSLVTPTYNERDQIAAICNAIIFTLQAKQIEFEIIVVDDDSPDLTWQLVERLAKTDKRIKLIRRTAKKGLASAVLLGWSIAEGDILGVIDADLQHPPDLIPKMLNHITKNKEVDIVIASKYAPGAGIFGWNFTRRFISWLARLAARVFIPTVVGSIKDPMSGFFILRKGVIAGKKLVPIGYKILLEVLAKGQYKRVYETPYIFKQRGKGRSKTGYRLCLVSFFHIIKLRLTASPSPSNVRKIKFKDREKRTIFRHRHITLLLFIVFFMPPLISSWF